MLCGPNWDFILNCLLFLLAIIPAHIHGFYISCVYFHRRHKVVPKFAAARVKSFVDESGVGEERAIPRRTQAAYTF